MNPGSAVRVKSGPYAGLIGSVLDFAIAPDVAAGWGVHRVAQVELGYEPEPWIATRLLEVLPDVVMRAGSAPLFGDAMA